MAKRLVVVGVLLAVLFSMTGQAEARVTRTKERYSITQAGASLWLPVYTSQPIRKPDAKVQRAIVVVHGSSRNADDYFTYIADATKGLPGVFIAAPKFATDEDDTANGQLFWGSGWSQCDRSRTEAGPWRISSCAVIDDLVATIRRSFPNAEVVIAGFSAGGQMVTRYAATNSDTRNTYLVGAPSSYLYMTEERAGQRCEGDNDYKYGLDNLGGTAYVAAVGADALRENFGNANVTTLVGSLDTDPLDDSLDQRCEAEAQGSQRVERMLNYQAHVASVYGTGTPHAFGIVPGVGHSGRGVLTSAAARTVLRGQ